jgi:hypothetical protein
MQQQAVNSVCFPAPRAKRLQSLGGVCLHRWAEYGRGKLHQRTKTHKDTDNFLSR